MEAVVITGASRGIGLALASQFANAGFSVMATHRGSPSAALAALSDSHNVVLHRLDVAVEADVAAFGETLADQRVDVLINNAGVFGPETQSREALTTGAWLETFAVNTLAPLRVCTALLPALKRADNPRIVTLSSQMGSMVHRGHGLYAYRSAKAALNKVMHVLSQELLDDGVCVCPIHPGWVRTDMGGDAADISVDESAAGIVSLTRKLTLADTGTFYTWDGRIHPW